MKLYCKLICVILILAAVLPIGVAAASTPVQSEDIIYFDDGSYILIQLDTVDARALTTKSGTKTYTYYGSDGEEDWKATLSAVFSYEDGTYTCITASCSVTIKDTSWYTVSKVADANKNTATADVTMGQKLLGITISKKSVTITLTCDANGNLT